MLQAVDLGSASLSHTTAELVCALSSSVKINCVDQGYDAPATEFTVDQLTSGAQWVSRGAGLRMIIDIEWADDVRLVEELTILREKVMDAVQTAELWKDLHFNPSVTLSAPESKHHLGRLSVSLEYRRCGNGEGPKPQRRALHRLATEVPFTDVRPPNGTPAVTMEEIHLKLSIYGQRGKYGDDASRLQPSADILSVCSNSSQILAKAEEEWPSKYNTMLFGYDIFEQEESTKFEHEQSDVTDTNELAEESWSSSPEDMFWDVDLSPIVHRACDEVTASDFRYGTAFYGSNCTIGDDHPSASMSTATLIELLDGAIRTSISAAPGRLAKSVKVIERVSFRYLADIAACLWIPGHMQAVAARTAFLPTISHALTSVALTSPSTSMLRRKAQEITRQDNTGCGEGENSSHSMQKALNSRLWHMVQAKTYGTPSARRLKSLQTDFSQLGAGQDVSGEEAYLNMMDNAIVDKTEHSDRLESSEAASGLYLDLLDEGNNEIDEDEKNGIWAQDAMQNGLPG